MTHGTYRWLFLRPSREAVCLSSGSAEATLVLMMLASIHPQDLTGRRRDWTPIAVVLDQHDPSTSHLIRLAQDRKWQLVSLGKFGGHLWDDMNLRGALVDKLPSEPLVRELVNRGIPTVRLGNWPHPEDDVVPAVMTDRPAYGVLAAEHFAERAFEHVACVGFDPWGENLLIYEALASRARELNLTCHLLQHRHEPSTGEDRFAQERLRWEARQREFTQWVRSLPLPVGLLAFGGAAADRYSHWAMAAGLRVPEDVAVLASVNDVFVCECAKVPLSALVENTQRLVATSLDLLARLIAGERPEQTCVKIPPAGIVIRQSTDVLAASDALVISALRYMWSHVGEDLSVDQIAAQVNVSRRTLERAFQKDLGRGINQEFQRRRLDRARALLLHTDWRIGEISDALHFNNQKYFCEVFRSAMGVSPTAYRRLHSPTASAPTS